ncbi:MAG: class I SAM-dependent methyltransferase [Gammaproteobacteria bacterium]|nr:class I SAM-dependent methyltransferase [Gammaproteobacteria bacterium]
MKPVLYHSEGVSVERYAGMLELCETPTPPRGPGFRLWHDESGMTLLDGTRGSLTLDVRAIEARSGQSSLLARACNATARPAVADLMAGWGTDGLSLALRGCTVTLVERAPIVWAMLDEFVNRLGLPATVVCDTAERWCEHHPKAVEVAYLDPMFPARRKTALPGKDMQYLRDVAWKGDVPLPRQIRLARRAARDRVVVKRRAREQPALAPGWRIRGRRVRFDVYRVG